jgi:RHS repeat-associated protein
MGCSPYAVGSASDLVLANNAPRHGSAVLLVRVALAIGAFLLAGAASARAGSFTAFGPRDYTRGTGAPVTVTTSFSVLNPNTQYTLKVFNGGLQDTQTELVSSGFVTVNGVQVVGPNNFNQNVAEVDVPVTLQGSNTLDVQVRGQPGGLLTIEIIGVDNDPPTIQATVSPAPNAAGWNNSNVTVSFTCSDALSGVANCPAPVTVTTEGANQTVSGTAVDAAGNTASTSVAVSLDKTPPALNITSPANGATVSSSSAAVTGTVTDALSGVSAVTCNGAPAIVQSGSFNCSITLVSGANTITAKAFDVAGNTSSATENVTFSNAAPPVINSFNPTSGPIGTQITMTGSNFTAVGTGTPTVTLSQQGGGSIGAPVASFTATSISFVIPAGAASGPVTVTAANSSAISADSLIVVASSGFSVTAGPSSASVQQGTSTSYSVTLSSSSGFSQLAKLSVTGLPSGVTAGFSPAQITTGQGSILTVTAPAGQTLGNATLTISASATVDGIPTTQSANVSLAVQAATTSLIGRTVESDNNETPIPGITITMLGVDDAGNHTGCSGQTRSDAAGNFALTSLGTSCLGRQLVAYDGNTATDGETYAGVNLAYTMIAGQVTGPELVHMPTISDAETIMVKQNASVDQVFSYSTIPGVTVTVYAGTKLTLPSGGQPDPFPMAAVLVPVDRLPDAPSPTAGTLRASIVAFQPANTTSSQPVSVTFPNVVNTPPGVNMELDTLDPIVGELVKYGTGTVSADATEIIPDPDPARPGHRFGISHFDWHGPMAPAPNGNNPSPDPHSPKNGDPVDTATGLLNFTKTDMGFGGARGQISLQRTYRTLSGTPGPFGIGTNHNYGYELDVSNLIRGTGTFVTLVMPDGNQFQFVQQGTNTFTNSTIPTLLGAVITSPSSGTYNLRWKSGTVFQFQTTSQGILLTFLSSITDANGNTTTLVRGNASQPTQITQIIDPVGRSLTLTYDAFNRILAATDPIGRQIKYTYNPQGTLATVTDPAGGVTTYGYDTQNRMTTITDSRGIVYLQNVYDANGRVVQQTAADGGITHFAYTLLNPTVANSPVLLTTVTDPLGNTITYHFSAQGFLQDVTNALGQKTIYTTDPGTNLLLSLTGPLGRTTTYTYDSLGNMLSTTRLAGTPDAVTATYTYDPLFSKVTSITSPSGGSTHFVYDSAGNLKTIKDFSGATTTFSYDNTGELISTLDPLGNLTQYAYSSGALLRVTDPLGRVSVKTSDAVGRLTSVTDSLGHTAQYQFNSLNQITGIKDAVGNLTTLAYDANGNLTSVTDPLDHKTIYGYDSMDRLSSRGDALGNSESYQYDRNGNLIKATDRRGVITTYAYDALNRKNSVNFGGESSISYSYDAGSRLIQAVDSAGGTITREYDALDRLTAEKTAQGTVRSTYDAAGRRSSVTIGGQPAIDISYDSTNRIAQIAQGTSVVSFTYDKGGRRTSMTLPNGVSTSYNYDSGSQLQAIRYAAGLNPIGEQTYSYDLIGRRVSIGGSLARTNLPTAVTAPSYNATNQLTTFASANLTYDANGNLTSDGSNVYSWDARNHLVGISGSVTANFRYDAFGRRIERTIAGNTTDFLYDGVHLVQELSGTTVAANMLGGGVDEVFQRSDSSGTHGFLADVMGSTLALTDSTGAVQTSYTYDPFGNTTVSGAVTSNTIAYTGRELDSTGLYYYRARYYSPRLQRFISYDPAGFSGGDTNLYLYARNNPTSFRDPSGKNPLCLIGGLLGSIGYSGYTIYQELSGRKLDYYSGWSGVGHILSGEATAFGAGCALGSGVGALAEAGEGTALATELEASEATEAEAAEAAEAEASDPCALCFPAGTTVLTRAGLVPIEKIKIGDAVLSRNRTSGLLEYKAVTGLTRPHLSRLLSLEFAGDPNPLLLTPEHPLFTRRHGAEVEDWVFAAQIQPGDLVLNRMGTWTEVKSSSPVDEVQTVYNFEVEDNHDYFVGRLGLLAHNAGPCDPNKLNHIFNNPDHNLDALVNQLGGQENAFNALEGAVQGQGLPNGVFSTVVDVGGSQVTVTGIVINGVARIGTAFIP